MSNPAKLHARPVKVTDPAPVGEHALRLGSKRDSYFYVPDSYDVTTPAPLILLLHGAGGHAHQGLGLLEHLADEAGTILVAPASTGHSWDVIVDCAYGTDVAMLDEALGRVFHRYAVDPTRIAIAGFSDGASYALSIGLANGDLMTHIIAFSPGFVAPVVPEGKPPIYISHGTHDKVLQIDTCSRRIVPMVRQAGYEVHYEEFDGEHCLPPQIARRAMSWFKNRT